MTPTIPETILRVLAGDSSPQRVKMIAEKVVAERGGGTTPAAVRTELRRLKTTGEVYSPQHGHYQLPQPGDGTTRDRSPSARKEAKSTLRRQYSIRKLKELIWRLPVETEISHPTEGSSEVDVDTVDTLFWVLLDEIIVVFEESESIESAAAELRTAFFEGVTAKTRAWQDSHDPSDD